MKPIPDIDALRRQRQLNVQQQNALAQDAIDRAATWFRTHISEIPLPIRALLVSRGIDLSSAVDVDFEDMGTLGLQGTYRGLVVTADAHFWRWELTLDDSRTSIECIHEWVDVTHQHLPTEHAPGIGKNYAFMCLAALARLNTE